MFVVTRAPYRPKSRSPSEGIRFASYVHATCHVGSVLESARCASPIAPAGPPPYPTAEGFSSFFESETPVARPMPSGVTLPRVTIRWIVSCKSFMGLLQGGRTGSDSSGALRSGAQVPTYVHCACGAPAPGARAVGLHALRPASWTSCTLVPWGLRSGARESLAAGYQGSGRA